MEINYFKIAFAPSTLQTFPVRCIGCGPGAVEDEAPGAGSLEAQGRSQDFSDVPHSLKGTSPNRGSMEEGHHWIRGVVSYLFVGALAPTI